MLTTTRVSLRLSGVGICRQWSTQVGEASDSTRKKFDTQRLREYTKSRGDRLSHRYAEYDREGVQDGRQKRDHRENREHLECEGHERQYS